jgi:hypothetical protein
VEISEIAANAHQVNDGTFRIFFLSKQDTKENLFPAFVAGFNQFLHPIVTDTVNGFFSIFALEANWQDNGVGMGAMSVSPYEIRMIIDRVP